MNYELAKQLKDAGFPQAKFDYRRDEGWFDGDGELSGSWSGDDSIYIPTLSELIEACKCKKFMLTYEYNVWEAFADTSSITLAEDGQGKTPEEAIARLWLALNKK